MSEKKATEVEQEYPDGNGGAPEADQTGKLDGDQVQENGDLADADADAGTEQITPEERIATLAAEVAELRDKWTRALAEAENVRRRAERDRRDAEAYGGTKLARDLLSVWDNLERAMKAADDTLKAEHGAFLQGVELTQRELLNAFAKHKIEKVTPAQGEKFDPNLHQAMFEAPVPNAEPGTVVEVLQDGFTIAERLLRPAMVGVACKVPGAVAPEEPSEAETADTVGASGGASNEHS